MYGKRLPRLFKYHLNQTGYNFRIRMYLHVSQEVLFFVHLLAVLNGRIQGTLPDSYSSGDLSRENLGRSPPERHESTDSPPSTSGLTSDRNDLESELERRIPRGSHGRSRDRGNVERNRDENNEQVQREEELENLQYADQRQLGRLVKNLQLQIKESKTTQVRTR